MATVCTSELTSICEDRFYQTVSDGLHREGREPAASLAQDERCVARQIDHRAGLAAARTGVDHEVDAALATQALERLARGRQAAQRVARVRRIGDETIGAHDVSGAVDEARLRMRRMDGEILCHQLVRCSSISCATVSG